MMRRVRGLLGLILLLTLAVGLPWALAVTVGNPLHAWSSIKVGDMSDQDVIAIMAAIAYLAWASFAFALVVEAVETVAAAAGSRPRRQLRIPLLGVQQDLARSLIAAVLLLAPAVATVAGPAATAFATPAPHAVTSTYTAPQTAAPATPVAQPAVSPSSTTSASTPAAQAASAASSSMYVIPDQGGMRSYWSLAEHYLGNGQRWQEIWQLNQGRTQADGSVMDTPRQLHRGWIVLIPAASTADTSPGTHDVVVHDGDTLSGLAAADGVTDWTSVWPANADRSEPGGERFTNPDLVKPGWTIALPGHRGAATVPRMTVPAQATPTHDPAPSATPPEPSPVGVPSEVGKSAEQASSAPPAAPHGAESAVQLTVVAEWVATVAAGAGVLAGGTYLALRRYRRRQFRHRRPGRTVAGPAPQHAPLEKVLVTAGAYAVRDVDFINRALRSLAAAVLRAGGRLPAVVAARLTEHHFDLVLAEAQLEDPPTPWVVASATSWVLDKSAELPLVEEYEQTSAPYPTLVSVGYTPAGEEWLIDLEQAGSLAFAGDPARCLDLARFTVAELAHNVWSDHLTVTLAGFGEELVGLNPSRLTHTDDIVAAAAAAANDVAAHRAIADAEAIDVLDGRLHGVSGDSWMPQVLFVAPHWSEDDGDAAAVDVLLGSVSERSARTAVAVVLPGDRPAGSPAGLQLTVHADGTLLIPSLDVIAAAQRLPVDQAAELAQYLAELRDGTADAVMPAADSDTGAAAYADLAGALLPEHTAPRQAAEAAAPVAAHRSVETEPVTATSLLPMPTTTYVLASATTPDDVAVLAPSVTPEVCAAVMAADPTLDDDLAAWYDPNSARAKLRLLGRVQVSARGQLPDGKTAIVTEAVTYLALHPRGVTGDRFAADFWPENNYTIKDSNPKNTLSLARSWLGLDPATAEPYLPYAKSAGRASGSALYRLDGLLVDADLFRRLRTRGEARGADGQADLIAALELVDGAPLADLRPGGGGWLSDDGVADSDTFTVAIVEVAHLVATQALATGEIAQARRAAQIAIDTGSADDRPLLDLAACFDAEGRTAELGATVRRIRAHHDADVEEDLPARTYEVLLRRGWIGLSEAS